MRAAFVINARNKAALVRRAVEGALAQTHPCRILLSDQASTDATYEEMERVAATYTASAHKVELLRCPIEGAYGMRACNQHIQWLVEQAEGCEWIFQCSADDYSLPERVRVCLAAVDELARKGQHCVGVACTMHFENPEAPAQHAVSGYPTESGFVSVQNGIFDMAYGSTIWAYKRDWLLKVGLDVPVTSDVYLGALASLSGGFYAVANPQHVHYLAADAQNMGFGGKMRAAEKAGDKEALARVNELNRFQLYELYYTTKVRQQEIFPLAHAEDQQAIINMMLSQSVGWYNERANLHKNGWQPGVLPA